VLVAEGQRREPWTAPDVEHRELHAHEYRVVERRRSADEFVESFGRHGIRTTVDMTARLFCIVKGEAPSG
jgi:hypothetical protein